MKKNLRGRRKVAVVVPVEKNILLDTEKISLSHCDKYLNDYDRYLISPQDISYQRPGYIGLKFSAKYFSNINAYSSLLVSKYFYEHFIEYEYILIYQLDALVFSDKLIDWCNKGYDYIGAPWYKKDVAEVLGWKISKNCVGNGGLSLRKVESHIKVIKAYHKSLKKAARQAAVYFDLFNYYAVNTLKKAYKLLFFKTKKAFIDKERYLKKKRAVDYQLNEDQFWSFEAKRYYPDFKIAPPEIALSFSFDIKPSECFERNNKVLPFGCHDWYKKGNAKFWEPYLIKSPLE